MRAYGMRNVLLAFMAGIVSAGLVLSLETASALRFAAVCLTALPVLISGLSSGALTCLIAGLAGAVVVTLAMGPVYGACYLAGVCVPVTLLVRQMSRSVEAERRSSDLLIWLTALGVAGLFGLIGYLTLSQGGLIGTIGRRFDLEPPAAAMAARIAPGLLAATWVAVIAASGAVAEWFVVRFGWVLRPRVDLSGIRLPLWIGPVLMVAGVTGAVARYGALGIVCLNLAIVLIVPFAFLGLAIIHAQAGKLRGGAVWIIAFYAVLLGSPAMFGWRALLIFVLMLAGLGSADQLLDLRGLRSAMRRK